LNPDNPYVYMPMLWASFISTKKLGFMMLSRTLRPIFQPLAHILHLVAWQEVANRWKLSKQLHL